MGTWKGSSIPPSSRMVDFVGWTIGYRVLRSLGFPKQVVVSVQIGGRVWGTWGRGFWVFFFRFLSNDVVRAILRDFFN
jgi:hypothetical protein